MSEDTEPTAEDYIDALELKIEKLEAKLAESVTDYDNAASEVIGAEGRIDELEAKLAEAESDMAGLQSAYESAASLAEDLQNCIEGLEAELRGDYD